MKFLLIAAALCAVAVAGPTRLVDVGIAGPEPIIDWESPISIGPAIVEDSESPISIGPAIVEEAPVAVPSPVTPINTPLVQIIINIKPGSGNPVVVDQPEIEPTPVIVVEEPEIEPTPVIIVEKPVIPEPVVVAPIVPAPVITLPDSLN